VQFALRNVSPVEAGCAFFRPFISERCGVKKHSEVKRGLSRGGNFIPSSIEKNLKLLRLPECVHLTEYGRCDILRVSECDGAKCTFCESAAYHKQANAKWHRQMNELSEERQNQIAAAYYGGKKPWKEDHI
jgi:hypothetical protein